MSPTVWPRLRPPVLATRHKVLLARLAAAPFRLARRAGGRGDEVEVRRGGLRWRLDLGEGIDFAIFLLGRFERSSARAYERLVRAGDVVLDVGANLGAHTLPLARLVGATGRVIAFEPTRYAHAKLLANLALNPALAGRVTAERLLLGALPGGASPPTLFASWPLRGGADLHRKHRGRAEITAGATATTVDAYLAEHGVGRVAFAKIDVDGNECSVLTGASTLLHRDRPDLLLELSPYVLDEAGASIERLVELLGDASYELVDPASGDALPLSGPALRCRVRDGASINALAQARPPLMASAPRALATQARAGRGELSTPGAGVSLPGASVVVCTRNRANSLGHALAALLAQDYPASWEIVVVDNGSSDGTPQLLRAVQQRRPELVRLAAEPQPGLSRARNAGIREARGEVVAFADDDALPGPGWLRSLSEALVEHEALVAGGPVEPIYAGELPAWLDGRFLPYLAVWDRGPEPHELTYNEYPRGNNMAIRREVFARFGTFSEHLGRRRSTLLSCEEIELCLRVERGGGRIVYAPQARVRHLTVADRVTPQWLARRFFAQGRSEAILEWRHAGWRGLWRGSRRLARAAAHASRAGAAGGDLYVRCLRAALAGHSAGVLSAPWRVPRYRPPAGSARAWLP